MEGDKIEQVREAASRFLDSMPTQNRVGLMVFNQEPQILHPLASWEAIHDDIKLSVGGLQADGDTALYDTLLSAIDHMRDTSEEGEDRIKAIVLLSDGKDTVSEASLNDVINRLEEARTGRNPVLVIPVAYGSDADIAALNSIARASATKVQSGAPEDILQVLEIISSYF
jgi:Ca-activated chloride channel family protein